MFLRNVSFKLKPDTSTQFSKTFEAEILPLLRKQTGFQNEIAYSADNTSVNAISMWDSKESADTYEKNSYPQVLKAVERFIEGTPKVRSGEILSSTVKTTASIAA
jgi:heme-degrading monooxygenase HmoA